MASRTVIRWRGKRGRAPGGVPDGEEVRVSTPEGAAGCGAPLGLPYASSMSAS